MRLEENKIYHGDSRELIRQLKPDSVACSIWSPPYHVGKEYEVDVPFREWKSLLREIVQLHFPVLKPGGFLAINIADILCHPDPDMPRIPATNISQRRCDVTREDVFEAQAKHPDYNRYQLAELLGCSEQTIDRRLNGNNIRGGKYETQTRVHLVGGFLQEIALEAGLYPYDRRIWHKDPAWQNSKWHTLSYRSIDEFEYVYIFWKPGEYIVDRNKLKRREWREWGSRGVWNIPSVRANNDHVAKFPVELPRRIIRLYSATDDLILDPFIGSGTTAVSAFREGRKYIGFDQSKKYVDLARSMLWKEKQNLQLHFEPEGGTHENGLQLTLEDRI